MGIKGVRGVFGWSGIALSIQEPKLRIPTYLPMAIPGIYAKSKSTIIIVAEEHQPPFCRELDDMLPVTQQPT